MRPSFAMALSISICLSTKALHRYTWDSQGVSSYLKVWGGAGHGEGRFTLTLAQQDCLILLDSRQVSHYTQIGPLKCVISDSALRGSYQLRLTVNPKKNLSFGWNAGA